MLKRQQQENYGPALEVCALWDTTKHSFLSTKIIIAILKTPFTYRIALLYTATCSSTIQIRDWGFRSLLFYSEREECKYDQTQHVLLAGIRGSSSSVREGEPFKC